MKSSPRLAQFGLRTIFALIFLSAVASLWLRAKLDTFAAEESAAERITRAGGRVRLEAARPEPFWSLFRPSGKHCQHVVEIELAGHLQSPEILRTIGSLRRVRQLRLFGSDTLTDADFSPLAKLKDLKLLWIYSAGFSDQGVAAIQKCLRLEYLNLTGTGITDDGARLLAGLAELKSLDIAGTRITDRGARSIFELKQLYNVRLPAAFSAASLRQLAMLPRLRGIDTSLEEGDEDGLSEIWRLRELRQLRLRGPGVTDQTIHDISKSVSLVRLELDDVPSITDACFADLASAPSLQTLIISKAPVSRDGVLRLQRTPCLKGLSIYDTHVRARDYDEIHAAMPGVLYDPSTGSYPDAK